MNKLAPLGRNKMTKKYKNRSFFNRKGQINIVETVVSATILLVLSVSIAQLGTKLAQSQDSDPIEKLKEKAQEALDLALSTGILRELVYAVSADTSPARAQMTAILSESLPLSSQYSLFQKTINNTNHAYNNRILLGVTPIPSGNINIFTVSVLVSGYFDTAQIYSPAFIVTLIVALGDY